MASVPPASGLAGSPSAGVLLTLGMFLFGMDTAAYTELERRMGWRHATSERFLARPASQFVGPGDDLITLSGHLVPEVSGTYGAIDRLIEMADTGDNWPLVDGLGRVLGHYRIVGLDQRHISVMGGGLPRAIDFTLDLERVD